MKGLTRISQIFVLVFLGLLVLRGLFLDNVTLGKVGVRRSNIGGVVATDLEPGWRLEIAGLHKIIELPSTYQFLDFLDQDALEIRTKDNNIVTLDISVPYRIKPGEAWEIVTAGNHAEDGLNGYRFQRLTRETTVGVLRQHLADLQSSDFYDTDRRNIVTDQALAALNEQLAPLHVEANAILMRAVFFRAEYETQLLQIQLNAQNKLLDGAR
ncbi:MAG: SPFH domain-containing protein, partial [Myxococcales bacterium]|nr:SPFH domain-containing protein [Myxococcales bacterium]